MMKRDIDKEKPFAVAIPDDEIAGLRAEAEAQARKEFVEIERKAKLDQFLKEARLHLMPAEEEDPPDLVEIKIDVPACCIINRSNDTGVVIDQREYLHGRTYTVPRKLAADITYAMARANKNEQAIGYPHRDMNRPAIIDARVGQVIVTGNA